MFGALTYSTSCSRSDLLLDPWKMYVYVCTVCLNGEATRPSNRSTHLRKRTVVLIRRIQTSADTQFSISFLAF
jgi:hypothetical protein